MSEVTERSRPGWARTRPKQPEHRCRNRSRLHPLDMADNYSARLSTKAVRVGLSRAKPNELAGNSLGFLRQPKLRMLRRF